MNIESPEPDDEEIVEEIEEVEKPRRSRHVIYSPNKIRAARHYIEDMKLAKRDRDIYDE